MPFLDHLIIQLRFSQSYNLVLTNDFSFFAAFFTNDVRIEASTDQPTAGDNFTLTCTVTSDRPPSLSWTGSGKGVVVHSQTVNGFTSTLVIEFSPLRTSHGGAYTCLSSISPSPSVHDSQLEHHLQVNSESQTRNKFHAPMKSGY